MENKHIKIKTVPCDKKAYTEVKPEFLKPQSLRNVFGTILLFTGLRATINRTHQRLRHTQNEKRTYYYEQLHSSEFLEGCGGRLHSFTALEKLDAISTQRSKFPVPSVVPTRQQHPQQRVQPLQGAGGTGPTYPTAGAARGRTQPVRGGRGRVGGLPEQLPTLPVSPSSPYSPCKSSKEKS